MFFHNGSNQSCEDGRQPPVVFKSSLTTQNWVSLRPMPKVKQQVYILVFGANTEMFHWLVSNIQYFYQEKEYYHRKYCRIFSNKFACFRTWKIFCPPCSSSWLVSSSWCWSSPTPSARCSSSWRWRRTSAGLGRRWTRTRTRWLEQWNRLLLNWPL